MYVNIKNYSYNLDEILQQYGFIGAYFYNEIIKNIQNFKSRSENFIFDILEFYAKNIEKSEYESIKNVKIIIDIFTSKLDIFCQLLKSKLLVKKELTLFKIILDILLNFYTYIDKFNFDLLDNEIFPIILLFYASLSNDDIMLIYDEICNLKNSNLTKN